ncbi:hypothetical protein ACN4EK_09575 [Pantanalinema rosaneae CENA516]|uniref:hypothetical protein n=1 Tax=Pantanalinema rosaneae TaxID=1620701 RepID=UPI003D6E498E
MTYDSFILGKDGSYGSLRGVNLPNQWFLCRLSSSMRSEPPRTEVVASLLYCANLEQTG